MNHENSQSPPRPTLAEAITESDDSLCTAAEHILEGLDCGYLDLALVDIIIRTPEEAAADLEAETGQQLDHGSTAAAIATLEERQRRLRSHKRWFLDLMETASDDRYTEMLDTLAGFNRQIKDTQTRLEQYRLQHQAAN
jgi:hypothetical protein